ncbi:MAG TPA: sigma-70 family RNA polymerase sigma factor [Egicoccus sp.]|nr:sigma-70 family RNA polymerase sigma factor [Egicoccus sp.]HSK22102.1 sigma-70 family RNA polymerase sigma factor [Egicoccus sp.]
MGIGDTRDDAALLAALPHDVAALKAFYVRYVRRVSAFAAGRCSNAEDVADVVAQTFLRLMGAAARYDPALGDPAAFVLGITGNLVRELHRGRSRHRALVAKLSGRDLLRHDDVERIEAAIDDARQAHSAREVLDAMPAGQRDVLCLVAEGRTPAEAARELGITARPSSLPSTGRQRQPPSTPRRRRAPEGVVPREPGVTQTAHLALGRLRGSGRLARVPGQELVGVDHGPEVAYAVALHPEREDQDRLAADVAGEPRTAVDGGLDDH